MKGRTLTQRELNRALLARQLLLERARLPIGRALERIGGIQAQYAPSSYVRLWTNLDRFARDDLTRALERKRAVQGTLMRSTIHLVSPRDYWLFSAGVGPSREAHWLRTWGRGQTADELAVARDGLRAALAGRTVRRDELQQILDAHGQSVWAGAWVELIRAAAIRYLGAAPRRPLPARGRLDPARDADRRGGDRAPAAPLPRRLWSRTPRRRG